MILLGFAPPRERLVRVCVGDPWRLCPVPVIPIRRLEGRRGGVWLHPSLCACGWRQRAMVGCASATKQPISANIDCIAWRRVPLPGTRRNQTQLHYWRAVHPARGVLMGAEQLILAALPARCSPGTKRPNGCWSN
ncbi:hypothetical protein NDU88_000562 [Pleurodeles waltl]|uniref:Uncharacterized protein n=1 Tax=Pleurodeles waltl TaxID=8319 RepID=A0AAV7US84_PLEWA|nr:hypothetical protein NDU88_000562 [Pleurodeles waltl]